MEFVISKPSYDQLVHKLKKLDNRIRRYGLPGGLAISSVREETRSKKVGNRTVYYDVVVIDVEGIVPVIEGWRFLARVEHTPAGNILSRGVDDTGEYSRESLEGWQDASGRQCDHCHTKRVRKDTFYLRHTDTGETVRIGRNCLADYLRTDSVEAAIATLSWIAEARAACDYDGGSDPSCWYPDTQGYLACAVASVRQHGYHRSRVAGSTAVDASWIYWPLRANASREVIDGWTAAQPTEDDKQKAKRIIAWVAELDADSEYLYNLKIALAIGHVSTRHSGLVASAVVAYDRAMGIEREKTRTRASQWIGEVGDKVDVVAAVKRIVACDTLYGTSYLVIFETEEGDCLKWFSSRRVDVEEGDRVRVKGTVKKHDRWNGTSQTCLTRCEMEAI